MAAYRRVGVTVTCGLTVYTPGCKLYHACPKDDINVICELLAVKHGDLELDLFSNSILDAFIKFLCTK